MMKQLCKAALGVLLTGFAFAPALAGEPPVLRSQVMTLSEIVTVGDFYSNAGTHAEKPLFRSPDMGTSGDVAANLVAERAPRGGSDIGRNGRFCERSPFIGERPRSTGSSWPAS